MKILIVTSDVTFVPDNYRLFLESLLTSLDRDINSGELNLEVAILKNNSLVISMKAIILALMGARNIGRHLLINSIKARFNDKGEIQKQLKKPIHYYDNPNSKEFIEFVKTENFDLLINARTRFIYKKKILAIPRLGCLNIHHGLLPEYRGTMCDLWALSEERPTGFTIHLMEKKIDDGAIVRRIQTSKKNEAKDYAQLIKESSKKEGEVMADLIKEIKRGLKLNHKIPIECENKTENASYTKNPNFKAIRKILAKGIKL